jgi:broad specificity phosphatase PhoE
METTKLIFLRHAHTQKDPLINAAKWGLSEDGKQQAENVLKMSIMEFVDVIYVSEEQKTFLTVEPLAKKINKKPQPLSFFNEVKRGDKFLTKEEFESEKVKQLTNLSYAAFDGETGIEALARFKAGIDFVVGENKNKTILIVTHGTILNIYFANLLNAYNELPDRWDRTNFCAVGVVEHGKVVQDIC